MKRSFMFLRQMYMFRFNWELSRQNRKAKIVQQTCRWEDRRGIISVKCFK